MQTVYQVSWFNVAPEIMAGLMLVGIGVLVWICWVVRRDAQISRPVGSLASVMLVASGILLIGDVVVERHQHMEALATGQCRVVEGIVTVLEVGWPSGHGHNDRIRIGTEEFQYSCSGMTYHWIIRNGGPLTNGACARLHVLDGKILKVEIKR